MPFFHHRKKYAPDGTPWDSNPTRYVEGYFERLMKRNVELIDAEDTTGRVELGDKGFEFARDAMLEHHNGEGFTNKLIGEMLEQAADNYCISHGLPLPKREHKEEKRVRLEVYHEEGTEGSAKKDLTPRERVKRGHAMRKERGRKQQSDVSSTPKPKPKRIPRMSRDEIHPDDSVSTVSGTSASSATLAAQMSKVQIRQMRPMSKRSAPVPQQ